MIRNRTIQLIYQTAFCTLGLLGVVASLGFFEMDFRWDFYIMYTADWILFYKKGMVKITYPFLSMMLPVTYILYVFIHAAIHHFDTSVMNYLGSEPLIYPYFFLNPEKAGVTGVVKWCLALVLLFVIAGFIFMGIDRLIKRLQARVKTEGI